MCKTFSNREEQPGVGREATWQPGKLLQVLQAVNDHCNAAVPRPQRQPVRERTNQLGCGG